MKTLLISVVLVSACGDSKPAAQPVQSTAEVPVSVPAGAVEPTAEQPSKAAVAHYCSQMAALTPESFANVPPAQAQEALAARMAESAKSKNLSEWAAFEAWLRATASGDRQPQMEQLIQQYGLQTVCRSVISTPIR